MAVFGKSTPLEGPSPASLWPTQLSSATVVGSQLIQAGKALGAGKAQGSGSRPGYAGGGLGSAGVGAGPPPISLVVQWLRICLPVQGTQVQSLVQEDST